MQHFYRKNPAGFGNSACLLRENDTPPDRFPLPGGILLQFSDQWGVAKAPLADQGWCSAQRIRILMIAGGNHTIIHAVMAVPRKAMTEGIRISLFPGTPCECNLTIPQSKIKDFCQLPLHKGARVLPHQCVYRWFSEKPENCTTFRIHPRKEETPSQGQGHTELRLAARDSPTG